MDRHAHVSARFRPLLAFCAFLLVILFLHGIATAAPDQKRLNREPATSSRQTVLPDGMTSSGTALSDSPIQFQRKKADPWAQHRHQSAYSDRAFLSSQLAWEKTALRHAQAVLNSKEELPTHMKVWAEAVMEHAEKRLAFVRTTLAEMGGLDRRAFRQAEQALDEQSSSGRGISPQGSFIMFLFPYCKNGMESAVAALLESPSQNVSAMARSMIIAQADLIAEVREWLRTHHYKNDI